MIFRLNGARVNALVVKRLPDGGRNGHEVVISASHDVHARDDLRLGKLPDMQLV